MEHQEYVKTRERMTNESKNGFCTNKCDDCCFCFKNNGHSIHCGSFERLYPAEAEAALAEWAKAHPLRTRLTVLKEQYPNCKTDAEGYPTFCIIILDTSLKCYNSEGGCKLCREKFWNEEVENNVK